MIYKTSLSDVIKNFMNVIIMTSQNTNRFHSNSTVKKCEHVFFAIFLNQIFRKYIGFTSN